MNIPGLIGSITIFCSTIHGQDLVVKRNYVTHDCFKQIEDCVMPNPKVKNPFVKEFEVCLGEYVKGNFKRTVKIRKK